MIDPDPSGDACTDAADPTQNAVVPCWTNTGAGGVGGGATDAGDLSILSRRSRIVRTLSETVRTLAETEFIAEIAASCLSLATASWAGQNFCIVSSSGVTTLTSELSTRAANRRYASQLNRGSVQRG